MDWLAGVLAITFIFGWPVIGMVLKHRKEVLELKLRMMQSTDQNLMAEIRSLRDQMSELRDTTTRYDVSFDTALQRVESRVGAIESKIQSIEAEAASQSLGGHIR